MSRVFSHTRPYGHLAQGRVRQKSGRAMGDHRSCCAATISTSRPRSRSSPWRCQSVPGGTITWREATGEKFSSRFARVRVRVAHRDYWLADSRPAEWLLIEWPDGEKEPIKYWLSTLPEDVAFRQLVDIAKLRWRIERDYQELKQEVGLGHFEGRGWCGFHHHATLCIAAYAFLISERETIPPSGDRATTLGPQVAVREGYEPRGSAVAA